MRSKILGSNFYLPSTVKNIISTSEFFQNTKPQYKYFFYEQFANNLHFTRIYTCYKHSVLIISITRDNYCIYDKSQDLIFFVISYDFFFKTYGKSKNNYKIGVSNFKYLILIDKPYKYCNYD